MSPRDMKSSSPALVLICEDEALVALDLRMTVEGYGHRVMGPCARMAQARGLIGDERPDVAVLDVSLRDGDVFPLAEELRAMEVGLIFHSGHLDDSEMLERFPNARSCPKPMDPALFEATLREVVATSIARRRRQ